MKFIRFAFQIFTGLAFGILLADHSKAQDVENSISQCAGDQSCISFLSEQSFKNDCVDTESAKYLNHGSMSIASSIAEMCLAKSLRKYHPSISVADVKKAAASAPNGVLVELEEEFPGIMDIGDGGILTLRAEENLDCRSVHPGGNESICNAPIDKTWIDENWHWWQSQFGGTRSEYEAHQLQDLLKGQERRRRLLKLVQ